MSRNNREFGRKDKINDQIRGQEVRLIGDNVENGVTPLGDAKELATTMGLDLVMINESASPPIVKIVDYKKYIFDSTKKKKGGNVNKPKPMKEMRYTPNIGDSDFNFKLRHVVNFLEKGHKVKAFVFFRGREMTFRDKGEQILLKLSVEIEDVGVPEGLPKFEGRKCMIIFKPKK